eukprot:gene1939-2374_t
MNRQILRPLISSIRRLNQSSSTFINRSSSSSAITSTSTLKFYSTKNTTTSKNNIETDEDDDKLLDANYAKIYYEQRLEGIEEYKSVTGKSIYESEARPLTHSIAEFRNEFQPLLTPGTKLLDRDGVVVAGRVRSVRISSNKLYFIDLESEGSHLQVMADTKFYNSTTKNENEFAKIQSILRKGDIIEIRGLPAATKVGEISIIPREITILSPCLRPIPRKLIEKEVRYRNRHLDFLVNPHLKNAFFIRSKMITFLRNYLTERGFLEVDTPILSTNVGGANAKPFKTHSNSLNLDLFLRISPELFLKQLVISGFDKVFEIGKQFRNEGIDLTHNPEFTTCEFYQAYADYNTVMNLTEDLLSKMVYHITGSYKIPLPSNPEQILDFTPPFKRISFVETIESMVGRKLPENLVSYDCLDELLDICRENGIHCKAPYTPTRILDEMASHLLEPLCTQPTFICDHPLAMSPLAKIHRSKPRSTERFELFVGGKELVNAYSELNDPKEQRNRFLAQSQDRITGDDEAQILDEGYCNALEFGLPPTGGWGLGIDRLCMLLSGTTTIKDVILFPTMKPLSNPNQKPSQE